MYEYSLEQWLLFFFIYCFLGWLWESLYVSIKTKKWVNRGFMHGPMLPIYGSGAIVVLFLALPVRNNYFLVFLFGLIGATILEYFTGMAMEKLFHMRYWDYTDKPFNIKGYVCLTSSVAWGFFSVAHVMYIHKTVEHILLFLPKNIVDIVVFAVTVVAVVDCTQSFNAAMDLREMLEKSKEYNEKLHKLERRVDVVAAVFDDDIKKIKEKSAKKLHDIEEYIRDPKLFVKKRKNIRLGRSVRILKRNPGVISKEFSEALNDMKKIVSNRKNGK